MCTAHLSPDWDEAGTEPSTTRPGPGPGPGTLDSCWMNRDMDICRGTHRETHKHIHGQTTGTLTFTDTQPDSQTWASKPTYTERHRKTETCTRPHCPLCFSSTRVAWLMGGPNPATQVGPPVCGVLLDSVALALASANPGHSLPGRILWALAEKY